MAPALQQGVTPGGMEWYVHACPSKLRSEVAPVLPGVDLDKLLIVPTCQHSKYDLVQTGDEVDRERDELLEKFVAWAQGVCDALIAQGHWAEYMDPCSGLPMIEREGRNVVYPEVDALSALQNMKTSNAGCCKVLLHPKWGSSVYPATMFTTAPLDVLVAAIQAADSIKAKV